MEAGKRKLHDIFNQNRVLEIPFFQRSYVWQEDNWDRFVEDMKRISDGTAALTTDFRLTVLVIDIYHTS